jgi:GTPase Era involved in 16S rRNA processing
MVEAKSKYNVIVLGMLGGGKSTIINQILGADKAPSNMGAGGCTKEPTIYHSELIEDLTVIDTPGFGDPKISTRNWVKAALSLSGTEMDAMILVCNSTNRVSNDQTMYTMAMKHILTNFNPKRVLIVFTRCGESGFF